LYANVCFLRPVSSMPMFFYRHTRHRTKKTDIGIQDTRRRKETLAYKTQDEEKIHWHTRHRTKKTDIGIQDTRRRKKTLAYKTQDEEKIH
jgi:hypothetical protein